MSERPRWRLLNDGEAPPAGRDAHHLDDGRRAWLDDLDDEDAADSGAIPVYLTRHARWLLWRTVTRINRKTGEKRTTKVPISYHTGKPCDVTAPASWTDHHKVIAALARTPGAWDGPGFVLGVIEAIDEVVIGLDLDTCLDARGAIADWALPFLQAMPSYAEPSPSGTGIKMIARIRLADFPAVRRLLDIAEGDREQARTRVFGERVPGQHAPNAQLFLMKRFFTITGRHWVHSPEDVTLLSIEQIAELAALFGRKERRANGTQREPGAEDDDDAPDEAALRDKLSTAFLRNPRLKERWEGGTQGLNDTTRSGRDMSVLAMLVTAGFTRGETLAALCWFEHGKVKDEPPRYFEEMWRRTKATPRQDPEPPADWEAQHPALDDTWNSDTGPDGADIPEPRLGKSAQLPVIRCAAGQLPRMVVEAEAALLAANAAIYQRGILVRPAEVEYPASNGRKTHSAALIAVTGPLLTKLLSQAAIFMKYDGRKKANVVCDPPAKLVDIILASRGDWRFPVVRGVLTSPTLRPDGSLLTTPGYDERSRYYLMFPSNLVLPQIPDAPTRDEALASLARLDALLDGYPFVDDVSRAVALSLLMTQVLRCAMTVAPLQAVSATAPSSGKSHLVDLASHLAIGRFCPIMGPGKSDEETEKGINTKLISGTPAFSIDNVHRALDIPALNIATERPLITVRVFGTLTDVEIENAVTIYMTGNNLAIIDEQMRRTVRCVLDAQIERPDLRTFTGDPTDTVLAERGRYLADILTIARAYLTNGTRPNIPPLGSYGDWSRFVREPLIWLGCADPVKSMEKLREDDPATIRLGTIINAWHIAFGMAARTLAEVASYATTAPIHPGPNADAAEQRAYHAHRIAQEQLLAVLREAFAAPRDQIDTGKWGYWMRKFAGRIADGMRFGKADGLSHQAVRWRLEKA